MKDFIFKIFYVIFFFTFTTAFAFAGTQEVKDNIIKQAKEMGVEPAIVLSIAKTESGFNQNARSYGGHIGVFQLSKETAKHLGVDPYTLEGNVKGGVLYYKNMYKKFGSRELAVAAYNTGPMAIARNGNKIPSRTQPFVNRIMKDYNIYKSQGL